MTDRSAPMDRSAQEQAPRGFDDALAPAVRLARDHLGRAQRTLARELQTLADLRQRQVAATEALDAQIAVARTDAGEAFDPQRRSRRLTWLVELDARLANATRDVASQEDVVRVARQACLAADQKLEALLRHRRALIDAHLAERGRIEQNVADDTWTVRARWLARTGAADRS